MEIKLDKKRLDGWKEISDHLSRDVRTCQRWERELGLPVYRVNQESNRSKVFSYTTELDDWFSLTLKNNNEERKGIRTNKRIIPVLLMIVVVAVFFGIFSFVFNKSDRPLSFSHKGPNPVRWDIKGSQIVVYNVYDKIFWTKEIHNSTPQENYYVFEQSPSETDSMINKLNNRNKIVLEDIDNDSKNEVLIYFNHEDPNERCFSLIDTNGQEMWTKNIDFNQEYKEGRIVNNYRISKLAFEDVDKDGKKEVLVLWSHVRRFPSIFLIYDLNGKELFRYAHTGILQFFILNSIKEEERYIFFGGTNNLLGGDAILGVLDCLDLKSGIGPPYEIPKDLRDQEWRIGKYVPLEPERASQKIYIRFKQNEVSRLHGVQWMSVLEVKAGMNEIMVHVNCGLEPICSLYYVFDPNFKLKYVFPGADFGRLYKNLYEEGKVKLELVDFLKKCEEDVLFWDGIDWISPPK
ncbi:MAG: hypothetical protein MUP98_02270 [Candidatus Aminicenantes bacterium]|nr:hypothetical protein [Candidatus Aminicenantes bacterium]